MERTPLRRVRATRYVMPLREGGSLPAIVEADDDGLYVLKFSGAGQGPLALVAELLAGQIGRMLQLSIPEIVLVDVDAQLGRNEPDAEIHHLLMASTGVNLGMDYLPGSVMFDQAAGDQPGTDFASRAVWFDAFIMNVDRTPRNPNLLRWHNNLYLIDHGASLYFHHSWRNLDQAAESRFSQTTQHVLLKWADKLQVADDFLRPLLNQEVFEQVLKNLPDEWLSGNGVEGSPTELKARYLEFFTQRLRSRGFVQEALEAHAKLL